MVIVRLADVGAYANLGGNMMRQLFASPLRAAAGASIVTALVVGGVGFAFASIPDSGGVIHGCYQASGTVHDLRVIDSAKTAKCPTGYKPLNWNQTGPQGPQGIQGPQGAQGVQGPQGAQGPAGLPNVVTKAGGQPASPNIGSTLVTVESTTINVTNGDRIEGIGTAQINVASSNEYDAYVCVITVDGQQQGVAISSNVDSEHAQINASAVTPQGLTSPTSGGSHTVALQCRVFQGTDTLYGWGQITATEVGP